MSNALTNETVPQQKAATLWDGSRLLLQATRALSHIEDHGIRVDVPYVNRTIQEMDRRIAKLLRGLDAHPETEQWKDWCRLTGKKFNPASSTQLAALLYTILKLRPLKTTEAGKPSTDDEALRKTGLALCRDILEIRKLQKVRDTYLVGLLREQVDGFIHPSFGLHKTATFRSQSERPNIQNFPVRNTEQGGLVRTAIIPRPGHQFGESDYSGLEVAIAACYSKDPQLVADVTTPANDMHRDMASECFILSPKRVTAPVREAAKGGFVFPEFYGDYYAPVATNLWGTIEERSLVTTDGVPLKEHLRDQGISGLAKFTHHIRDVEHRFWNVRYRVYHQWRKDTVTQYEKRGWMLSLTGFRYQGPLSRNAIMNYCIQGSAFHCLLWSLIELNQWLKKANMDTRIVGEIHDSMLLDYHPDEVPAVVRQADQIMSHDLLEHWQWIIVPLRVKHKIAPVDHSWHEIKPYVRSETDTAVAGRTERGS